MADVNLVQGDTRPDIRGALTITRTKLPLDLTGATVKFQMKQGNDRRYTIDAAAEIVEAAEGTVRYVFQPGDLSHPGLYNAQWEVTYPEGAIQTTTPPNTIEIRRQ